MPIQEDSGMLSDAELDLIVVPDVCVPQHLRRLKVVVVEDNNRTDQGKSTPDITESLKRWIASLFGGNSIELTNVDTEAAAVDLLEKPNLQYDVALIDLDLGPDNQRGGIRVMARTWDKMSKAGTVPIIYSANVKAREPFAEIAEFGRPFQMVLKAEYKHETVGRHWNDSLREPLIRALRKRVWDHCQEGPEPASVKELRENFGTASVCIKKTSWSVASLLSPFLVALSSEHTPTRDDVIRALFPSDDLIRVLTYWFKAQQEMICWWPNNQMYGLTPLAGYHVGIPTGPMDALMHDPNHLPPTYRTAGEAALKDLQVIKLLVKDQVGEHFRRYIEAAMTWPHMVEMERVTEFKKTVMFKLEDDVLETIRGRVPCREEIKVPRGLLGKELYCAPDMSSGCLQREPVVTVAARKIAESIKDHAGGEVVVTIDSDRPVLVEKNTSMMHLLPNLYLAIAHQGTPCAASEDLSHWFDAVHSLGQAAELLRGYMTWTVLSKADKTDSTPRSHEAVLGQNCGDLVARALWKRFNPEGSFNVIHVLQFGLPLFLKR